ncbi:hypothetical protein [Hyphomicrobium sp.]|uniref:hypothetical protein n=1 Tax=Hyphomicrobium sp. TaxID=82 RepID=UPI002B57972E|nr:hypothetical protein [Hyphomicrobium sp.]HRN88335.1 hypothetical protein [Hyphomicrobium sp.]HRQ26611.1 hypothetical protein [Hyphomicrobium sp.]
MTDKRSIAYDATFMILYIGVFAAMATLSVMLIALGAIGAEFGGPQLAALTINIAGWSALPFAPKLYRWLLGHPFSWRTNGALGGVVET